MLSDKIRARYTLSTLVAYLNLIDSIDSDDRIKEIRYLLSSLAGEHEHDSIEWDSYNAIADHAQEADKAIAKLPADFTALRNQVFQELLDHEDAYYGASFRFYQDNKDSVDGIDPFEDDSVFKDVISKRINLLTNWQHPGVVFRPQHCEFMRNMVSCDPLYLVDTNYDSMLPAIEPFGKRYQRRLCLTESIEYIDQMLNTLPQNQVGFILVTNFFELRPIELIEKYFKEFLSVLRPGGTVAFTYNNCDYATAVKFVEDRQRCYTPGRAVIKMLEDLGYEILFTLNHITGQGYIECKRDGELSTIRGGQTLARPVPL